MSCEKVFTQQGIPTALEDLECTTHSTCNRFHQCTYRSLIGSEHESHNLSVKLCRLAYCCQILRQVRVQRKCTFKEYNERCTNNYQLNPCERRQKVRLHYNVCVSFPSISKCTRSYSILVFRQECFLFLAQIMFVHMST